MGRSEGEIVGRRKGRADEMFEVGLCMNSPLIGQYCLIRKCIVCEVGRCGDGRSGRVVSRAFDNDDAFCFANNTLEKDFRQATFYVFSFRLR